MAGVRITLENKELGVQRSFTTEKDGTYVFFFVAPADDYSITAVDPNGAKLCARPGSVGCTGR